MEKARERRMRMRMRTKTRKEMKKTKKIFPSPTSLMKNARM